MRHEHLATLLAVVEEGGFDAAAWRLGITASAVSQRIKALETEVGRVAVRRTSPCQATEAGYPLLRMARQVRLLEAQARAELGLDGETRTRLDVAINADSFATWVRPLLGMAADWPDATLRITLDDQEHTAGLLRRGEVLGAVTSTPDPVAGCRIELLGVMRYLPVAHPTLVERHTDAGGAFAWAGAPTLRFSAKDDLQSRFLHERAPDAEPPTAQIPTSEGFVDAVRAGLGWAMLPEEQLGESLVRDELRLLDDGHLDVKLYWQVWRLESLAIERLTDAIQTCATVLR